MGRRFALYCLAVVAGVVSGGAVQAQEETPRNPDCPFMELNGVAVIDERTAILDMSTRVKAPAAKRRWFKVTFASNCRRLKGSHFFELKGSGCPKHGDVIVFSRRPFADEQNTDRCTIDKVEEIPVQEQ